MTRDGIRLKVMKFVQKKEDTSANQWMCIESVNNYLLRSTSKVLIIIYWEVKIQEEFNKRGKKGKIEIVWRRFALIGKTTFKQIVQQTETVKKTVHLYGITIIVTTTIINEWIHMQTDAIFPIMEFLLLLTTVQLSMFPHV